jgi:hypothetical protein
VVDDPLGLDVVEQAVDGEVAPARVVGLGPEHVVAADQQLALAALLLVARVGAEGRGLDDLVAEEHRGQPEPAADDPAVAEQGLHLVGRGAGGDVEVLRLLPEQEIAYAAADQVGLVTALGQLADDAIGIGVDAGAIQRCHGGCRQKGCRQPIPAVPKKETAAGALRGAAPAAIRSEEIGGPAPSSGFLP